MSLTVQNVISLARSTFHDGYADHYQLDALTPQVDGARTRFRVLNRQVLRTATGAPIDPVIYANGAVQAVSAWDYVSGAFTITPAPALGVLLQGEYYFALVSDTDFINFALAACRFVGTAPIFTALNDAWPTTDALVEPCQLYMAAMAAGKMADLSSWWYQANAGNKAFNKDQIAAKFQKTRTDLLAQAKGARDDVYLGNSKYLTPASAMTNMPGFSRPYTPER